MPKVKSTYRTRDELVKEVNRLRNKLMAIRSEEETATVPSKSTAAPTKPLKNGHATDDEPADLLPEIESAIGRFDSLNRTIQIRLTPFVRSLFAGDRRGLGGFQSLHRALQARISKSNTLTLSGSDFARIVSYATNYGDGGFQQSLRWLVSLYVAQQLPEAYVRRPRDLDEATE